MELMSCTLDSFKSISLINEEPTEAYKRITNGLRKMYSRLKVEKIENKEERPFSYKVNLNVLNWKETYSELQRVAELSINNSEVKTFSVKSSGLNVKVSEVAKTQMRVYHLIVEDESFMNRFYEDMTSVTFKEDLVTIAKNALSVIDDICKKLSIELLPYKTEKLNVYENDTGLTRGITIDENNRFVYRATPRGSILEVMEVMFNDNDKLIKGNKIQEMLIEMFNYIINNIESQNYPNYINDVFSKIEENTDPKTFSDGIPKPRFKYPLTRFNSMEEIDKSFKEASKIRNAGRDWSKR